MEEAMRAVIELIRSDPEVDDRVLERLLRSFNKGKKIRSVSKKNLVPYYLQERKKNSNAYASWSVDETLHMQILEILRAKPGRTASGVATISVLMKPWPCGGDCLYCPNDIRMPKSYIADEPACQRAEAAFFDPYLQVIRRLRALSEMGHNTDKVELIVLGGTFDDYTHLYREWFVQQLFEALNDFSEGRASEKCIEREACYRSWGMTDDLMALADASRLTQILLDDKEVDYNTAVLESPYWKASEDDVIAALSCVRTLEEEHERNEISSCRCVGLVVETRPECITCESLEEKRHLGCTKIQFGIQSLDLEILDRNCRHASLKNIQNAFELTRIYGFKSHVHLMQNLPGASLSSDIKDFDSMINDPSYKPDEVKLYPCALVESSKMTASSASGEWQGYDTEDLVDLLARMVAMTPRYTRISRMIRDIPSNDIIGGNKITNLRQLVEGNLRDSGTRCKEIRMREIRTGSIETSELLMLDTQYETSNTIEHFLEYVDGSDRLAGFLRLSLPKDRSMDAMIREVHIYGKAARIGKRVRSAQHSGLGRSLIERALMIAASDDRSNVKVISAVGTRDYYRKLGFSDRGLYQSISLEQPS